MTPLLEESEKKKTKETKDQSADLYLEAITVLQAFNRYITKKDPTVMSIYVAASGLQKVSHYFISEKMDIPADKTKDLLLHLEAMSDQIFAKFKKKPKS